jgi:adenylylsulfate kinase-like enzyme
VKTIAVLLTGAPGAGKSSVLQELANLLELEAIAFGALDSEQLAWGSPALDTEPWLAQLRAIFEIQRWAGRSRFLVAATTETTAELQALREAIAVDRAIAVLLSASPDVVAARIDAREPDTWVGKQALIDHARHLAASMEELSGVDLRVSTAGRDAHEVAVELRDALGSYGLTA